MFKIESLITNHIKANETIGMTYTDDDTPITVFYGKDAQYSQELFAVMSGIDEPLSGTVFYNDIPFNNLSHSKKAISISEQTSIIGLEYKCESEMTVFESLKNILFLNGFKRNEIKTLINEQMEFFNLYNLKNTKVKNLDDISRLNYFFAKAIIKQPKFLLIHDIENYLTSQIDIENYLKLIKKVQEDFKIKMIIFTHFKRIDYENVKIIDLDEYNKTKQSINDEIVITTEFEIKRSPRRKFGINNYFQVLKLFFKGNLYGILAFIFLLFTELLLMNCINIFSITPIMQGSQTINTVLISLCILFLISFFVFSFWAISNFCKTNQKNLIYLISNGISKTIVYLIIPIMAIVTFGLLMALSFTLSYIIVGSTTDIANVELSLPIWIMLISFVILVIYTFIISTKIFKNQF